MLRNKEILEQNKEAVIAERKVASIVAKSENSKQKGLGTGQLHKKNDQLMVLSRLVDAAGGEILNREFETNQQIFQSLFDNNIDAVFSMDRKGRFLRANKTFLDSFGFSPEELTGKDALEIITPEEITRALLNFLRALKGEMREYMLSVRDKRGKVESFQVRNIPIHIDGEITGLFAIGRNISEQNKMEKQLAQLAHFDPQTGLPNRAKFTDLLIEQMAQARKRHRELAVVFIDIDRFKNINDSLGHHAGDAVLGGLAERIKNSVPRGTFIGRFAGDKFTLLLTEGVSADTVNKLAIEIADVISKPFVFDKQELFITSSIGICMFPEDGEDEDSLLKNADTAMNKGKAQGGNKIVFYSNEMNEQAKHRFEIESGLHKALINEEFFLCYQPLVELESGKVHGSEALIRWAHPEKGLIPPADFIPIAEETGLIEEIGSWVLHTACMQNKKWQEGGNPHLKISVNVSAFQFQQPHFVAQVKDVLEQSGLQAEDLHLELTETAMIVNLNYSIATMRELQGLGVKVSIDDFGTGYSSLSYLKDLPIDCLKIDRSFINNLKLNTSDIAIVKAIITMGQGLSVKVVAEGVETEEQLDLLKEMNCQYAQGFYIDKPLTSHDFERNICRNAPPY